MRSASAVTDCKLRIWLAINRDTRQIVGVASGDRGDETCLKLRQSLPAGYRKRTVIYTDYRESYADIPPSERHRAVGKESGGPAHIGRSDKMKKILDNYVEHFQETQYKTG